MEKPSTPTCIDDDPVWQAAMTAPLDDTPDTEEERAAILAVMRTGFQVSATAPSTR